MYSDDADVINGMILLLLAVSVICLLVWAGASCAEIAVVLFVTLIAWGVVFGA